jgi:transcriptional regulator with XRE-family HTH domain
MKTDEVDLTKLAALVAKKRDGRPFREIAEEIGDVSSPTLSRIEKGRLPDLETFMRLCRWLGTSPETFQTSVSARSTAPQLNNEEEVCAFLRADRNLPSETANALTKMIELAYRNASGSARAEE